MKLSVVVPCCNEEGGLRELHRRLTEVCREAAADDYEIVLVNDGSKDATWTVMAALAAADRRVVAINLSRNFGHQMALSAGLKFCRGERAFILDADLQDPPELLGEMMARMDRGCDVVYGRRTEREGETWTKRVSAHLFYRLLDRLVDTDIPADVGDFRLMSRRALDVLNAMPEHHRFIRGMVGWIGMRQDEVRYERAARFAGRGNYPLGKMIRLAIDAVTGFSTRPLRIATYVGMLSAAAALLVLVYAVIRHLEGHTVEGWTSLAVIVMLLGSVQMIIIGVLGEYVGRLYIEAKGRPLYVVQDILAAPELAFPGPRVTEEASL